MTSKAVTAVRRKHRAYAKYKDNTHPAYIKVAKIAQKKIRKAKRNYETKSTKNIKKDTKSFYAYVRSRSKTKVKVGPLLDESGSTISDSKRMAKVLNNYFFSVFTKEDVSMMVEAFMIFKGTDSKALNNITINVAVVKKA